MRPDRPRQQHHRAEGQADFHGRDSQPVPFALALHQVGHVSHERDQKRHQRGHPARRVQIKNALHRVHGLFVGRHEKRRVSRHADQRNDNEAEHRVFFHDSLPRRASLPATLPADIRRTATMPSKTPRRTRSETPASPTAARDSPRRRAPRWPLCWRSAAASDRKSTRLNSSHSSISYAVFCLKKKKTTKKKK